MPAFDEALRRQHARLRAARAGGMPRLGWKICLNDPRHQRRLGLDGPFVGFLDGARRLASGDACAVPSGAVMAVEPEIAIRVGSPVADDSLAAAGAAMGALAPALEIVDYARAPFTLDGVVESSSFHHGVVLGAAQDCGCAPVIGPDGPRLLHDGAPVGVPDPALVPGDLREVVRLVARALGAQGERLVAGDWILSGACTAPVVVVPGATVEAAFGALGSVGVRFVAPAG